MLDLEWVLNALKEARDEESWDLIKEVIAYLEDDDVFQQYKEDEAWWKGADDNN